MLVSGSSIDAARDGRWLLGPFPPGYLWQPWTLRAITGADWIGVLQQAPSIVTAVFVAVLAMPMNVGGTELTLRRDLDPNRELRDAGVTNVVVGAAGGIPGYHAVGLISLADRLRANARGAGIVGALVPLLAVLVGVDVLELVPRMLVGGVLVYAGLGLIVEWLWDRRVILSPSDRLVVLAILLAIAWRGLLPGVVLGLVLSLVQFAIDYGRIELVSEAAFGETFRSTVDRAPAERAFLRAQAGRVQILRADGFVFFGTASALLERVRRRAEAGDLRYLVVDLHRVSGMDASAVVSLRKAAGIARTDGFELVFTGMSQQVRARLARGAVMDEPGVVGFEPDLDHGLQRCEDGLLAEGRDEGTAPPVDAGSPDRTLIGVPAGLDAYLERIGLAEGSVLIHQGEDSEDLFLLAAGRLRIEMAMRDGTRIRMRTVLPGVVVGEIALYTGTARTADVTAETPSEVLRLSRASIERLEAERPELATAVHRWLASTVAERLTFTQRAIGALID
jgi:SulP family sulfate permease